MPHQQAHAWDRDADLEAIRLAYARYDASGRRRIWDRRNRGYSRLADELRAELIDALRRSVSSSGRVVDLGCGRGALALHVKEAGLAADWIGVDIRADAIRDAKHEFPGGTWITASADEVPLPDATVDAVVAEVLFSSLPSRQLEQAVAQEIARILVPGGWLVWVDIRFSNPGNPNVHGVSKPRLAELFPGWYAELRPAGLLPPLARRLGHLTPIMYPALRAVPPFRSHLVGRLQRPV